MKSLWPNKKKISYNQNQVNIIERAIGVIAPHECLGCGHLGVVLCESCRLSLLPSSPSRCYRCHKSTLQSQVCTMCRKATTLSHAWVATDYDGVAKDLIYKLKFARASVVADLIARHLSENIPLLGESVVVTYAPTANSRVRSRGYDQSKLIAKNLAKVRGWQFQTLLKREAHSRQVGASREQRFSQLEGAFSPLRTDKIKNAHILLIDDVITTGATVESAAKVLKKAGAKTVDASIFAQANF